MTTSIENRGRRASKEFRREQLINATIDNLEKRGFGGLTLADVAISAGLSRGIVNFHFESKEKLLLETLRYLVNDYVSHWQAMLAKSAQNPSSQMRAFIVADLDKVICNPRKLAAWFAFLVETKTHPAYKELYWFQDDDYVKKLTSLCEALKIDANYHYDSEKTAFAIYAMQDGLWLRLMLNEKGFKRSTAIDTALRALGTLFPHHFESNGTPLSQ
ncbi:MAG: AcrR family transcriptional regulator [Granulosicoccus sp.]|jgi:TetR/AcrR family transcriptional repressor of bet genes